MPHTRLRTSFAFAEERLAELKAVVPEAFADGKVNWTTLREALGENLEDEGQEAEHFGLFWPGKRAARRLASMPSRGTLVPVPGDGVSEERTKNLFIEGDNLEVLKLLQKAYAGRVKMIYIDPPYNTGNDFVYNDDFTDPLGDYLRKTGQADEEGRPLTTNTRADGRFHSNWLSMMYPRLRMARELLSEDGLIFVSIDDNEIANLRLVMSEVFGEESFIACIVWQKRTSPDARLNLAPAHDYIVVFARANPAGAASLRLLPLSAEREAAYQNPDQDPRGPWASADLTGQTGHATPSQFFSIRSPTGKLIKPPEGRCWALAEQTLLGLMKDNRIWFGKDGTARPRLKKFLSESEGTTTWTWWTNQDVGHNQEATKEVNDILGKPDIFSSPKPTRLIKRMILLATRPDAAHIVMDFFAGSGSTAQAVLETNREDGGNRSFLCVQLPELLDDDSPAAAAGYKHISDITRDRIRRVIARMTSQSPPSANEDLGCRNLYLSSSHFRQWKEYEGRKLADLQSVFDDAESPLTEDWTPETLLMEVALLEGFPIDSTITELTGLTGNTFTSVTSNWCAHRLLACLDAKIKDSAIEGLALQDGDVLVCLDTALNDQQKLRLADRCNLKTI